MKSPLTVVVIAAVTSLAITAALEVFRGQGPAPGAAVVFGRSDPSGLPSSGGSSDRERLEYVDSAILLEARDADRLAALERRIEELEQRLDSSRVTLPSTRGTSELPAQDDLRELVLNWVAADRESRRHAAEVEGQLEREKRLEFEARHRALLFAKEHSLSQWQEEEFAKLFLEMGIRTAEIEDSIDVQKDDPEEVERRWLEFDVWIDRRERELTTLIDPELYKKLYGED